MHELNHIINSLHIQIWKFNHIKVHNLFDVTQLWVNLLVCILKWINKEVMGSFLLGVAKKNPIRTKNYKGSVD